jgi:DNA polymerase epsilon subunit 1
MSLRQTTTITRCVHNQHVSVCVFVYVHRLIQLKFRNVKDLITVRQEILALVQRNLEKKKETAKGPIQDQGSEGPAKLTNRLQESVLDAIVDVREYDVPYVMRVAIDNEIFVGLWYDVSSVEVRLFRQHVSTKNSLLFL